MHNHIQSVSTALQRPIFLVGAARSGTTLLQSMVDAHPDISILGELHFFDQILRIRSIIPEPIDKNRIAELRSAIFRCHAIEFIPEFDRILDSALTRLNDCSKPTYADLFALLLQTHQSMNASDRVGEKTPNNIRYLSEILAIFPDAQIVHILRHPLDSISSRLRYPWSSSSIIFNTLMWKIEMMYAIEFKKKMTKGCKCYFELRYEDLVIEPERELGRLCDFLDVAFAPEMLRSHQRAHTVFQNEPWKDGTLKQVNSQSVSAWRARLRPQQVSLIEKVAGNYAIYGGYERYGSAGNASLAVEAFRDFCRYVPYKITERFKAGRDLQSDAKIGSDSSKLYSMLKRAIRDPGPEATE